MSQNNHPIIAVVNDDPTQRALLAGILKKEEYQVLAYGGAEEALRAMTIDPPHLIVTDLYMPNMDGWRFCRLLRSPEFSIFNHIPILVVSATYAGAEVARVTAELGANAFLPAPVEARSFLNQVRELLNGKFNQNPPGVLIVEDSRAQAELLAQSFTVHGYRVQIAHTGLEAWKFVRKELPEVVCLDYHLPDMKGARLLKEFRSLDPSPTVVVMTGDPNPELALQVMKQNARAYVRKPFDPEYLVKICDSARHERSLLQVETLLEKRTQELRKNEARFRTIIEDACAGYFFVDLNGRFQQVNQAWLDMHGFSSPDEVIGEPFALTQMDQDLERAEEVVTEILFGKPNLRGEFPRRCKDGSIGYHTFSVHPVRDGNQIVGMEGFLIDTTDLHLMQAELIQARKMESIGTLAGGIAHDFNNILTTIQGYAELALFSLQPENSLHEKLTKILQATNRAANLTRQLLVFSRKQPMEVRSLCLNDVLKNLMKMLYRLIGEDISVEMELSPSLWTFRGDAGNIEQVIMNLVVNARDAMPLGGKITIKTENIHIDQESLDSHRNAYLGKFIVVSIEDTGLGMDKNTIEQIFDPFFTTKGLGKGTGLGLSVVYGSVNQHKGWVNVESEPGQGSLFKVYLPAFLEVSEELSLEEKAPLPVPKGRGERILVVEDDDDIRELVEGVLSENGYAGVFAKSSEEALALFAQDPRDLRLVLSDVVLPGMSGLSLAEALHDLNPNLKILLSSGYTDHRSHWDEIQEKGYQFIPKPYQIVELLRSIKEVLG